MWLQPLDLDAGGLSGGPLWLRIASDGTAREVRLPARFDALRFTRSRIWGVYRDEFDRPSVASLPLPHMAAEGGRQAFPRERPAERLHATI